MSTPTTICPTSSGVTGTGGPNILADKRPEAGQERIAQHFGFEPPDAHAAEEPILGIDGVKFGAVLGRLPIGSRGDDHALQAFEFPAAGHEVVGQPIEQCRVRRRLAKDAEIGRRGHQAAAEMVHPKAIDQHAGDQRMVAIGQVPGVGESSAAGRELWIVGRDREAARVEHGQLARGNILFGRVKVSAGEQFRGRNLARDFGQALHEIVGRHFFSRCFGAVVPLLVESIEPIGQVEIDRAAIDI